jgi:hypothetical protein
VKQIGIDQARSYGLLGPFRKSISTNIFLHRDTMDAKAFGNGDLIETRSMERSGRLIKHQATLPTGLAI